MQHYATNCNYNQLHAHIWMYMCFCAIQRSDEWAIPYCGSCCFGGTSLMDPVATLGAFVRAGWTHDSWATSMRHPKWLVSEPNPKYFGQRGVWRRSNEQIIWDSINAGGTIHRQSHTRAKLPDVLWKNQWIHHWRRQVTVATARNWWNWWHSAWLKGIDHDYIVLGYSHLLYNLEPDPLPWWAIPAPSNQRPAGCLFWVYNAPVPLRPLCDRSSHRTSSWTNDRCHQGRMSALPIQPAYHN